MHRKYLCGGIKLSITGIEANDSAFILIWVIDIKISKIVASFLAG